MIRSSESHPKQGSACAEPRNPWVPGFRVEPTLIWKIWVPVGSGSQANWVKVGSGSEPKKYGFFFCADPWSKVLKRNFWGADFDLRGEAQIWIWCWKIFREYRGTVGDTVFCGIIQLWYYLVWNWHNFQLRGSKIRGLLNQTHYPRKLQKLLMKLIRFSKRQFFKISYISNRASLK